MADRDEETWTFQLPSNRGWNLLEGELLRPLVIKGRPALLVKLRSTGRYVNRDDSGSYEVVEDHNLALPQVVLSEEAVARCVAALRRWLAGRLDGQDEFDLDIGLGETQVHVELRVRPELICRPDKPGFFLRYVAPRFRAEVAFVVDPSCVDQLCSGLTQLLEHVQRQRATWTTV